MRGQLKDRSIVDLSGRLLREKVAPPSFVPIPIEPIPRLNRAPQRWTPSTPTDRPCRPGCPRPVSGSLVPRGSSGLPEAASQSPLSIRVALHGARRYWWLVLMLWVVGSAGIGAAVYLKVKPSYKAYSIVRVVPASNDLYGVRTSGENFDPFLQTLVNLVTSPNVLTAAGSDRIAATLDRVKSAGDVVQELRKVITVGVIPNTYLIEVSMTSNNSYEAAILAFLTSSAAPLMRTWTGAITLASSSFSPIAACAVLIPAASSRNCSRSAPDRTVIREISCPASAAGTLMLNERSGFSFVKDRLPYTPM